MQLVLVATPVSTGVYFFLIHLPDFLFLIVSFRAPQGQFMFVNR
jgi:hypothetical protein